MTDEELIAAVRSLMPGQTLTDEEIILAFADAETSLDRTLGILWRQMASKYAGLVDVQEGSSSRKLSQLHQQALTMAAHYGADDSAIDGGMRPGRTRRIVRDAG